ncbi:MAG: copper homeostasis protein CutC [Gemmatimonadales bacterium]
MLTSRRAIAPPKWHAGHRHAILLFAMLLEACVDTLTSALRAEAGGADRIELCADLADAGTTPSHGVLQLALERLGIPIFPMIRARGGGFVCGDDDRAVMRADLRHARQLGAPGAVVGALTPAGDVDADFAATLRDDARGMQLTFHRAFDVCRDPRTALDALIRLGFDRVLTSGQAAAAWEGRRLLSELVSQATGRITVMAGGGITEANIADLIAATGVREVHVRGTALERDAGPAHRIPFRKPLPADELVRAITLPDRVAKIRAAAELGNR